MLNIILIHVIFALILEIPDDEQLSAIIQHGRVENSIDFEIDRPISNKQYFAGTTFKSSTVLHINMRDNSLIKTPGVILPMKNKFRSNTDWTLETWVYAYCGASKMDIMSIEGSNTFIGMYIENGNLFSRLTYGLATRSSFITNFNCDQWNHVSLTVVLESSLYYIELGLNNQHFGSQCRIMGERLTFDYFYIGTNSQQYSNQNQLAFKEIRLWNVELPQATITSQMQRQIRNPEPRLVYYYPIDEMLSDHIVDKSFEGEFQVTWLWAHTSVRNAPTTLWPPQLVHTSHLAIPSLMICDEHSYFDKSSMQCERDNVDSVLGLEQSTGEITIPLSDYQFTSEWTLGFWLFIEKIIGRNTPFFSQRCRSDTEGTISLTRIDDTNRLRFSISEATDSIIIPIKEHRWFYYSFVNNALQMETMAFRDGIYFASIPSQMLPIVPCDITIGSSSDNTFMGKFKELAIWNTSMTANEISIKSHQLPSLSSLAFYLPMNEGSGESMIERVKNKEILLSGASMDVKMHSKRVWTSQGELRICRKPFIYSSLDYACICIFFYLI